MSTNPAKTHFLPWVYAAKIIFFIHKATSPTRKSWAVLLIGVIFIASLPVPPFRTEPMPCFGASCTRGAMVLRRTLLPQITLRSSGVTGMRPLRGRARQFDTACSGRRTYCPYKNQGGNENSQSTIPAPPIPFFLRNVI